LEKRAEKLKEELQQRLAEKEKRQKDSGNVQQPN
jgi:hypothetical protein